MSERRRPRGASVRRHWVVSILETLVVLVGLGWTAQAGPDDPPSGGHPYAPSVAPASPDAGKAMAGFQLAPGVKVDLFAAEPLLANPVAFGFDEKGRVFVVETFRLITA